MTVASQTIHFQTIRTVYFSSIRSTTSQALYFTNMLAIVRSASTPVRQTLLHIPISNGQPQNRKWPSMMRTGSLPAPLEWQPSWKTRVSTQITYSKAIRNFENTLTPCPTAFCAMTRHSASVTICTIRLFTSRWSTSTPTTTICGCGLWETILTNRMRVYTQAISGAAYQHPSQLT